VEILVGVDAAVALTADLDDDVAGHSLGRVRTVGITPALAQTAASLPTSFRGDPADRLVYATAVEHDCQLVTKDRRLRDHPHPRRLTVW
jgi:PIN domain nuclease of toxin-antitoxin system